MTYMVDTCIFNALVKGLMNFNELPQNSLFAATPIQKEEILATDCDELRRNLLENFESVVEVMFPAETTAWDVGNWDAGVWDKTINYQEIKEALDEIKRKGSNPADALIAEASIANKCTLITTDNNLSDVIRKFSGLVLQYPHRPSKV